MSSSRGPDDARFRASMGMRTDPEWLDHVERTGRTDGPLPGFPVSDDECADLQARHERGMRIGGAVREADLDSAAGCWIDQLTGGTVHVALARPSDAERAIADRIVAGERAVVDLVAHTTRELRAVEELIGQEPTFRHMPYAHGISSDDNAVHLTFFEGCAPEVPASLRAAVEAGMLTVEYTDGEIVGG